MPDHADVAGAQAQLGGDLVGSALGIEGQHHDGPLALGEALQAAGQVIEVEGLGVARGGGRGQGRSELLEKPLSTGGAWTRPASSASLSSVALSGLTGTGSA